ncbi:MAG TPA: ribonuclease PH [Rhodospirillales bacterium]|jgi:ribonuclease PH|nr:ribonuclease PH [Rhodospirillales bacterium]HIL77239.1 ribonuclease PH [Rhodospirillales bacterium]
MVRPSGRIPNQMRDVSITPNVNKHAEGSCLIKFGDTHVICTASIEERLPPWLRDAGHGWVTAEYGMLPRSTNSRSNREAARGGQGGRTHEIQRLIGRSLRAITNLNDLGEIQIRVDCDVIQADGGTRTASITGGFVALHLACQNLVNLGVLQKVPLRGQIAAISCGIYENTPVLDLDYLEDSNAQADSNFVLTENHDIAEIQGTAEQRPFSEAYFIDMLELAKKGVSELILIQKAALEL